jgi:hypothetical protein
MSIGGAARPVAPWAADGGGTGGRTMLLVALGGLLSAGEPFAASAEMGRGVKDLGGGGVELAGVLSSVAFGFTHLPSFSSNSSVILSPSLALIALFGWALRSPSFLPANQPPNQLALGRRVGCRAATMGG